MTSQVVATPGALVDVVRAQRLMRETELDAIVANSVPGVYYLSSFLASDTVMDPSVTCFALLPADASRRAAVALPEGAIPQLRDFPSWPPRRVPFGRFFISGFPDQGLSMADGVEAIAVAVEEASLAEARLGVEMLALPIGVAERLRARLPGAELVDATELLNRLRMIKTPIEIERLRHATAVVLRGIDTALSEVRPGVTEIELDRRIREVLVADDVQPTSVFVGTSDHGADVMAWATGRAIAHGDVLRIDVTAAYGMYHADLSRNVAIGTATNEERRLYAISREAMEATAAAMKPGATTGEIFAAGVAVAREQGLDDFRRHNVGHGLGLQVHEHPLLAVGDERVQPGMVLSAEAPYYRYGGAGYSPEDTVYIGDSSVERWTTAPMRLPVIG